jgi:putative tricarboxylic transport membrane protein
MSAGNQMKKGEIFSAFVLFLFGAATAILSSKMDIGTFRKAGTGMFPLFLGILLMVLSGSFLLKIFFKNKKTAGGGESEVETPGAKKQLVLFLGALVLNALLFDKLGYPLSSFLLMLSLLRILGIKQWGINILISAVTAAGSYFLFVQSLNIPMPKGWIGI